MLDEMLHVVSATTRASLFLRSYIAKWNSCLCGKLHYKSPRTEHKWPNRLTGRGRLGEQSMLGSIGFLRIFRRLWMRPCTAPSRATTVNHHHGTNDEDAAGVNVDEVAPHFQRERCPSLNNQVRARLEMDLCTGLQGVLRTHFLLHVLRDCQRNSAANFLVLIASDLEMFIPSYLL